MKFATSVGPIANAGHKQNRPRGIMTGLISRGFLDKLLGRMVAPLTTDSDQGEAILKVFSHSSY